MADPTMQLLHVASDGSHHPLREIERGGAQDDRDAATAARGVRAVDLRDRDPARLYRCAEPDCRFWVEIVEVSR